ncbi:MAG: outer membrane lipoprotein LolB [Candidatus Azotimanducaceae bacterium]
MSVMRYYIALLLIFLSGCAGLPSNQSLISDGLYATGGKLIVIQPDRRSSANFRWSQQAEKFQLEFWGPVGVGRTLIAGSSEYAELSQGSQIIDRGSPSLIMQRQLGWSAPIDVLPFWIQGVVAPNMVAESVEKDDLDRLLRFTQAGWSVSYTDHVDSDDGWVPRKITIQGRDLQLRLIIRRKNAK